MQVRSAVLDFLVNTGDDSWVSSISFITPHLLLSVTTESDRKIYWYNDFKVNDAFGSAQRQCWFSS